MEWKKAYIGLGGNIGDVPATLKRAIEMIAALPTVKGLRSSRFYLTTPVSSISQDYYVNAVCEVETTADVPNFFASLQEIEKVLGKVPKSKESPRTIDIDLLLFGAQAYADGELQVPHSQWTQRLFVLLPLLDLVEAVPLPSSSEAENVSMLDIKKYLIDFPNVNREFVTLLSSGE